jgi:hypothetical protein
MTAMHDRARALISQLQLEPHPEGGCYRRIYQSPVIVAPPDGRGARPTATAIYYLLAAGERSRWHRVRSDEIWVHVEGGTVRLACLDWPQRALRVRILGEGGEPVQVVPAGTWQAAELTGESYALMSCIVSPGFEWSDFEWMAAAGAEADWLSEHHPELLRLLPPAAHDHRAS